LKLSVGSLTYYTTALIKLSEWSKWTIRTASAMFDEAQYVKEVFEVLAIKPKIVSPVMRLKL